MKNLIIFVLALIALSSVFSVKLNKVLKEEKVLGVSKLNDDEELDNKSEVNKNDNLNLNNNENMGRPRPGSKVEEKEEHRPRPGSKIEEKNEKNSLRQVDCNQLKVDLQNDERKDSILQFLNC